MPAARGGTPVRGESFLHFSQPRLSDEEIASVVDTLRSGWLTTAGKTRQFEKDFCEFTGAKLSLALNSLLLVFPFSSIECRSAR